MTAAGVKETLLENQQSFIVGKMDMKGKQKRPPFSGRFSLLLSLSTGCSNARFCNDRAKIRRSEFVISHVLDEFSEVVGDEDAFLPQQAKLVADPWLDRNLHDVFRKGHCRVEEGTTVAGRKTVEDCRQLAAVHFDMRSCSFGTEAGDDGVRLDGVRVEKNDRLFLQCFEGNRWFLSQVMILVYTVHVRIFNDGVVIVVIQIVEIQIGDSHIQFIIIDKLAACMEEHSMSFTGMPYFSSNSMARDGRSRALGVEVMPIRSGALFVSLSEKSVYISCAL